MNRKLAPEFKQAESLELIFPEKIILENGSELFWFKAVKDESVKLDIEWFAGSKYQDKKLTASFTNRLLLSGNSKKSAKEIATAIDFYGGFVQDELDKDHANITLYGLRENFNAIFSIFVDALLNCEFPAKEFEEEITSAVSKFRIDSEKVKYLCQRKFNECLFGAEHPYGKVANEKDFLELTREDLVEYHKAFYLNSKPVLFLVGNVDNEVIESIKIWSKQLGTSRPKLDVVKEQPVLGLTHVAKKDAIQCAIRIGRLAVDKQHPDYFGLQVLDTLLGGYFGSRLMANIREDKGYTYGIGSGVAVLENSAYFFITTEVAKNVKDATLKEIYFELDKLKSELIPEEELSRVKNYMLGEFLRHSDGPTAMMESFKNIWFNKLPDSYYTDFISAVKSVNAQDLMVLANRYFVKEEMVEIVVG